MDTARNQNTGAVYTPKALAEWAAELLHRSLPSTLRGPLLDPSCGDGALLQAIRHKLPKRELVGVDIDLRAVKQARSRIGQPVRILRSDALVPSKVRGLQSWWENAVEKRLPAGVLANPPWGATIFHTPSELRAAGYSLAHGQFDSFEIFIELTMNLLQEGGVGVFIVPDSIFQPEHEALRKLLINKSTLILIARLGEGFFENIYRGTVVLVFQNQLPRSGHKIRCLRVDNSWRKKILSGSKSFTDAERALTHWIPQSRFRTDPHNRFDIDSTEDERERISVIERHVDGWTEWLDSSRGVELSKSGMVLMCPRCRTARPSPKSVEENHTCRSCGHIFALSRARYIKIVNPAHEDRPGWQPLIVGEDVDRYRVEPSRYIRLGVEGINYKNENMFVGKKIVVRKTGVGIKAAIDKSGAFTNQVVFIYRLNKVRKPPKFLLEYFLGVLCSRIMLAYYLKKIGETEWRSHPYITQRRIAELPVPNLREGTWQWRQARAIADAVATHARLPNEENDLKVERLVAGLYGMSMSDCGWVASILNDAQGLEPIRTLRVVDARKLSPIRVQ